MENRKVSIWMLLFLITIIICTTTLLAGCKDEPTIKSSWRDREIQVDGDDSEWQGCPQYHDEDTRTVISVLNDENNLFVRFSSDNREIQRQMMVQGFTLWLEQEGENPSKIGVHFPVGLPREERMSMARGPSGGGPGALGKPPKGDPGSYRESLEEAPRSVGELQKMEKMEIQLLGPGESEQKTMAIAEIHKYNVDVKVNETERGLVYELKVPITKRKEARYAFLQPGKEGFRLGLQTGDMGEEGSKSGSMGQRIPGGREGPERGKRQPRGGGGGQPGGGPGGPGAGGKKDERHQAASLNLWLKVTALAEKKGSDHSASSGN